MGDALAVSIQLLNLFISGVIGVQKFTQMRDQLQEMQAEGRDPTQAEWDALLADVQKQSDELDAADKALNPDA